MSEEPASPTINLLTMHLGFIPAPDPLLDDLCVLAVPPLKVEAWSGINAHFARTVFLTCFSHTGRSLYNIESQMPLALETKEEAIAWVSHALRPAKRDLLNAPDWLATGEQFWPLLPWKRSAAAHDARPRCHVARDEMRLMRKRIYESVAENLDSPTVTVHFDGEILQMSFGTQKIRALASGKAWTTAISADAILMTKFPRRFMRDPVEVSYFEERLVIGNTSFAASEVLHE